MDTKKEEAHKTTDPFVAFLYELTRDHVTPGVINKIISDQTCESMTEGWLLSDKEIATLAERWVQQLKSQTFPKEAEDPSELKDAIMEADALGCSPKMQQEYLGILQLAKKQTEKNK